MVGRGPSPAGRPAPRRSRRGRPRPRTAGPSAARRGRADGVVDFLDRGLALDQGRQNHGRAQIESDLARQRRVAIPHDLAEPSVTASVGLAEARLREVTLALAAEIPVRTSVETFALRDANRALQAMKDSKIEAAAVLVP